MTFKVGEVVRYIDTDCFFDFEAIILKRTLVIKKLEYQYQLDVIKNHSVYHPIHYGLQIDDVSSVKFHSTQNRNNANTKKFWKNLKIYPQNFFKRVFNRRK